MQNNGGSSDRECDMVRAKVIHFHSFNYEAKNQNQSKNSDICNYKIDINGDSYILPISLIRSL